MSFKRPVIDFAAMNSLPKTRARTCADGALVRPIFTLSELINAESELGRTIFGEIPAGHSREFFEQGRNIWIWHESWMEGETEKQITVRYEVRRDGVYKKVQGSQKNYTKIEGAELENFVKALRTYLKLVKEKLY